MGRLLEIRHFVGLLAVFELNVWLRDVCCLLLALKAVLNSRVVTWSAAPLPFVSSVAPACLPCSKRQ